MTSIPAFPPPPFFLASHLALDFLNSYATPDGQPVEWLGDGLAFAGWYLKAGLATSPDMGPSLIELRGHDLDTLAANARKLRELIRSGLRAAASPRKNQQLHAVLNQWMAKGSSFRRLEVARDEVKLVAHERCDDADQFLVPLATAAAQLLVEEDLTRVRVCDGSACSLWFLDRTKSGTRRFCSAETCGNRAKAAAFRARKKTRESRLRSANARPRKSP